MRAYDDGSLNFGYSFLLSFPFYFNTSAGRKLCLPKHCTSLLVVKKVQHRSSGLTSRHGTNTAAEQQQL